MAPLGLHTVIRYDWSVQWAGPTQGAGRPQPLVQPVSPPLGGAAAPSSSSAPERHTETSAPLPRSESVSQSAVCQSAVSQSVSNMALTNDPNYKKLEQWYKANAGSLNMRDMFEEDKDRFNKFRLEETREGGRDGGDGGDGGGEEGGRWA